ncbi:MAG: DegT/DnrJ/EryC1/StrS family aminotransferase [Bacteroidetes bacterium]|nr:DegT/DnrJ/EryC1/StrS family aminotransferase [Bacteroidota bacterium]
MINVTKTYLPPIEEYYDYLKKIWEHGWVTNNGPLVQELEQKLKDYLGVKHLIFCSNGTIALQIAIKALGLKREIITTPFSYVATVNSILWENCTPVFVDIDPNTLCIDANKIEEAITENTEAILAVHVYGIPCDVKGIGSIAAKQKLKVIYDGAHAFGVKLNGTSVFNFGDVSTCSFHATKLFHTVEGGAIITNDDELAQKIIHHRQFGHSGDDYFCLGVNGKNSEMHAAMGLCNLPKVDWLIKKRKEIFMWYTRLLAGSRNKTLEIPAGVEYNYAYFPAIFSSEREMLAMRKELENDGVFTRRYFFPSLNSLPHYKGSTCPVSEDVSRRVLSLPLSHDLTYEEVERICSSVTSQVLTNV